MLTLAELPLYRQIPACDPRGFVRLLPIPYIAPFVRLVQPEKQDPEGGRIIRRAVLDEDPVAIDQLLEGLTGVPDGAGLSRSMMGF